MDIACEAAIIFAERHAAVWELLEGVYLSLYPSSAQKAALDRAVSFTGVSRLGALWASVFVVLYGTIGTVVPAGSKFSGNPKTSLHRGVSKLQTQQVPSPCSAAARQRCSTAIAMSISA
jgi:uncharacterized phage protein gp47/JayE